jgi:hypothetical protein
MAPSSLLLRTGVPVSDMFFGMQEPDLAEALINDRILVLQP